MAFNFNIDGHFVNSNFNFTPCSYRSCNIYRLKFIFLSPLTQKQLGNAFFHKAISQI